MNTRRPGDRVIQIHLEWPARYGTVLEVKADTLPAELLIGWDDGRQDWIEEEDFPTLRIWFISEDGTVIRPRIGPLEMQLSGFMRAETARQRLPQPPKGFA